MKPTSTIVSAYSTKLILLTVLFSFSSCERETVQSRIPYAYVNYEINLSSYEFQPLKYNDYIYLDGGNRGIILYKQSSNQYRAFERNCPYNPQDECALVSMHSSLFYMEDTCCNSAFDFNGIPTSGPASQPLKEYYTFLDGNYLYITSDL